MSSQSSPLLKPTKHHSSSNNNNNNNTNGDIHLRPARLADHPAIARLTARAFHNDILFGHIIHPLRHTYPTHPSRYWLSRNLVAQFDWSHRFVVAVARLPTAPSSRQDAPTTGEGGDGEREIVIGQIHWSRMAVSDAENCAAGWGLGSSWWWWWDPRRLLRPLISAAVWLASRTVWRNCAADPAKEQIIEGSYGFIDHVWNPDKGRSPSWYVESMAVDPDWQGRGVGRMLVEEGLRLAEREGISASVISADGKEGFYRKCGFVTGPVGRSGEGLGNPLWDVPGGLVFFREKPGCRKEREEEDREVDECMQWLRRDMDAGWQSSWIEGGCVD